MAAPSNTTKAADLVKALDIEAVTNYKQDHDRLLEILGIFGVEKVAAGTALYRYKVTGELSGEEVAEGDETPLSKFAVGKEPVGEITTRPFRRLVTHQAILFDYQSECHCSKTGSPGSRRTWPFDYQSECHCSKTPPAP